MFGPYLIKLLSKFQVDGQPIRLDGPESHLVAKKGTPTMGGFIILLSILISILLWSNYSSLILWPCVFIMLSFGAIGFLDDYTKLSNKSSDGVSGKNKIILEIICSLIFVYWATTLNLENQELLSLPFLKNVYINLGYFFIPFIIFVIIGLNALSFYVVICFALSFIHCYLLIIDGTCLKQGPSTLMGRP